MQAAYQLPFYQANHQPVLGSEEIATRVVCGGGSSSPSSPIRFSFGASSWTLLRMNDTLRERAFGQLVWLIFGQNTFLHPEELDPLGRNMLM